MFKVAIGHSEDPETMDAVQEIISQCRATLGSIEPQAGIVFSDIDYDYAVFLQQIKEAFPTMQLIGCTSGGDLSSRLGYTESSLGLIVFASNTISMATTVARDMSKGIAASVTSALSEVKQKLNGPPVLGIIFPDIFTVGLVSLVHELQSSLGVAFPLFGGGASDPKKFDKTREFYEQDILQDSAPMLFFSGPLEYISNVASGWEPFTDKKKLMHSTKNIAFKIGEASALEFYKHYLSGPPTMSHPLAVFESDQQKFYLRVPLEIDEAKGSIVFGGDLPVDSAISICQADSAKLIAATHDLIKQIRPAMNLQPACALIFSCACRQSILGSKTAQEFAALQEELPEKTPLVGFYAYGQVCAFEKNSPAFVHNDSIVALMLYEAPPK